jgi:ubiquinone/menaquinone biosynthesis C-methylase UbiE
VAADLPLAGPDTLKTHVTDGFAAAAHGYDADGTEFFGQVGHWLVQAAQVPAEAWVLDVGCGKGAVSIPAAQAVGPRGHVTGIDLAAPMLAQARERARAAGLSNVTFEEGDAEDPGTCPGWPAESFDVVLAGNVLQFLPRPVLAVLHWYALLTPGGTMGAAWTVSQESRWLPVIAAVDAYVPDGVPAFGTFMRRPPFDAIRTVEKMLAGTGYQQARTITRDITVTYTSPEQWWAVYQTQGPWALSWRHIPPARLADAQRDAFVLLEPMRAPDGSLSRTLTFAVTTGRRAVR